MALNLMGFDTDAARLRRISAILRDGMGPGAAPLPAAVDLLSRALRPLSVLAVFALVAAAFVDPPRYGAAMLALRGTPAPVWLLAGLVTGLHFLARIGGKAA